MKKITYILVILFINVAIFAQNFENTYTFKKPVIENKGEYQIIKFQNTLQIAKVGNPLLPYMPVNLLLPYGVDVLNVEFIYNQKIKIEGNFNIYPYQGVSTLENNKDLEIKLNKSVYNTSLYPNFKNENFSVQYMNGFGFLISKFTPVEYNPITREIWYYQSVTLKITYFNNEKVKNNQTNLSNNYKFRTKIEQFSDKSSFLKTYPEKLSTSQDYDILIITATDFVDSITPLADFHLQRAQKSKIVSLTYIDSVMQGVDLPQKMRNYIIQEYQNCNIQYVILGGDADVVPYRGFYCYVQSGPGYSDNNIPADVYFSSLDGNWNANGNNLWGEKDDNCDLLPDIAVGRLPFSNFSELNNIIHKIIYYSNYPVTNTEELENPLLAGENLYNNPLTFGSDYLKLLIGHHEDNGYITDGIPDSSTFTTMYSEENAWGKTQIISALNNGHSMTYHVGHSNKIHMMFLEVTDITNLNFNHLNGIEHNYALVYSHGCNCGAFDYNDCVAETMLKINNFAVGTFVNSRYGWFDEGTTEGPSEHLNREFVNALYALKQNNAGVAEMISKIKMAPWIDIIDEFEPGANRWVFYDHNVLTDPALSIWTQNPVICDIYVDSILKKGDNLSITIKSDNKPFKNANCILMQNNSLIAVATTDSAGIAIIHTDSNILYNGFAKLYFSGNNMLFTEKNIFVYNDSILTENTYLQIFPNPSDDFINILMLTNNSFKVDIYNQLGQKLLTQTSTGNYLTLNVQSFKRGVYFLEISVDSKIIKKKFVIQK